jgi:anti-anti-sigma factor
MSALGSGPARLAHVPLVKVVVTEALDAANVPVLRDLLDEALALRPARLVVEVGECSTIDSAAVAVLLDAHREIARSGGRLALRELPERLRGHPRLAEVANEPHVVGRTPGPALASQWWAAVWAGITSAAVPRPAVTSAAAGQGSADLESAPHNPL